MRGKTADPLRSPNLSLSMIRLMGAGEYDLAIVVISCATVTLRRARAASGVSWGAVASVLRPWIADKRSGSHGLRVCRGQWAGRDQGKVLQEPQRRAPSRELVARDERSGLRGYASCRTIQGSFSLSIRNLRFLNMVFSKDS